MDKLLDLQISLEYKKYFKTILTPEECRSPEFTLEKLCNLIFSIRLTFLA